MARPLQGIRVVECGNFIAGPLCGMLLGDMGADVIKVEPPKGGDLTRNAPPHVNGESVNFVALNRNKRSIALNLKDPLGRAALLRLAEKADVLIENFRPGRMAELGLSVEDLRKVNPDIIYISVSGFGQFGTMTQRAAVNLVIEAAAGTLSVTGESGELPMRPGVQTADVFGALFATYAVLSGLVGKLRQGGGRAIDVSLMETSVAAAVFEVSEYLGTGTVPQPIGRSHRLTAPYQVFRARDGLIVIGCPNDQAFRRLAAVLDLPDIVQDPRFASYSLRKTNEAALVPIIVAAVAQREITELEPALVEAGLPCSRVNDYKQSLESLAAQGRDMVVEAPHPSLGTARMVRNPILFDRDGPQIDRAAPLLGQHSEELLRECGYSDADVAALRGGGVIVSPDSGESAR